MHMDENTCVELALDPSVCVLDDTGGWVDAPEVVSRNCLDCSPVTPELLIQLRSTVGSVQPGEDIALVFLCGFERKCLAIGDGQRHTSTLSEDVFRPNKSIRRRCWQSMGILVGMYSAA